MAYGSTPYEGMTPKKMAATLKVYKCHTRHGPLTLLESIAEVPDWQVAKTGKSSNLLNLDYSYSL